jgi:hypothetical protein
MAVFPGFHFHVKGVSAGQIKMEEREKTICL